MFKSKTHGTKEDGVLICKLKVLEQINNLKLSPYSKWQQYHNINTKNIDKHTFQNCRETWYARQDHVQLKDTL